MRRRKLVVSLAGLAVVLVVAGTPALAGLGVVVAAGAIAFALWPEPPSRITWENFDWRRMRKLLLALAGLAVVVGAGAVVLWPREDRITEENCFRIHRGMTPTEVEAILGPPGDYTTRPTIWGSSQLPRVPVSVVNRYAASEWRHWDGDTAFLSVAFNSQRKVLNTYYLPNESLDKSPLDTLVWRVKRQWHRWFPE
jgi:hypothetical protein